MKYKILGLGFLLLWSCNYQNREPINNSVDSSKSKLKENLEVSQSKKWEIKNFVDEFRDTLKEKFVITTTSGFYTKKPYTSNFPAYVEVIIKKSNTVGIRFYSTQSSSPYPPRYPIFDDFTKGTLKAKNSEGKLFNCSVYEKWSGGGLRINSAKLKSFILESNGIMKIVIQENDIMQFNFEIDLTDLKDQIALI